MPFCNEKPPSREIGKAGNKSEMEEGAERHKLAADDAPGWLIYPSAKRWSRSMAVLTAV
jgi:hypothetical protein